jgi:hypothetical protein
LVKFWRALQWKMLLSFMAISSFDIFMAIWYIFFVLVCCIKKNLATLF